MRAQRSSVRSAVASRMRWRRIRPCCSVKPQSKAIGKNRRRNSLGASSRKRNSQATKETYPVPKAGCCRILLLASMRLEGRPVPPWRRSLHARLYSPVSSRASLRRVLLPALPLSSLLQGREGRPPGQRRSVCTAKIEDGWSTALIKEQFHRRVRFECCRKGYGRFDDGQRSAVRLLAGLECDFPPACEALWSGLQETALAADRCKGLNREDA